MIPLIQLGKSGIQTSRLGFGTSRLHHLRSTTERQKLLAEAADLGIRHFDTAPAYGDGLAERELGKFLKARRDKFIVATKWGLPASPLIEALGPAAFMARAGRALLRRAGLTSRRLPRLTALALRHSFDQSRRRLGLERVDILVVHEPAMQRLEQPQEIVDTLQEMQARGMIASYGLAGAWRDINSIMKAFPHLAAILQTGENEWKETDASIPDITFGALAQGPQSAFSASLSPAAALERLGAALHRRPNGVVLVSTLNRKHLQSLAGVASEVRR